MATYTVSLPITGVLVVEVEADSEDAAIHAALERDLTLDDLDEWEATDQIVRGNVFRGLQNEANAIKNCHQANNPGGRT